MVSLADLTAVEDLGLRPVHLGDDIALRWVASSELPDPTPYLEGGELLLTTGLETSAWTTEWSAYVARLVATGVAGLALGTGLTHAEPPAALARACRKQGLALLEVPQATPFVAVSRAAADLLQDEEARTARLSLDFQRRLTRAALDLDLGPLLERLAELLEGAVVLLHADGVLVQGPLGPAADDLDLGMVREEVAGMRGRGLGAVSSTTLDAATVLVRPIGLTGRPHHFLAVVVSGPVGDAQRSAIATAVVLLSLALERRSERRAVERRLVARALEFLLAGDPGSASVLLEAVERKVRVPTRLRVLQCAGNLDHGQDALHHLEDDGVLAATTDDVLTAVVAAGHAQRVARRLADLGLRVGIGRAVAEGQAASSNLTAGHALARTSSSASIRRWDEVADGGPLALVPPAVGRQYAVSLLAPVSPELRATLSSFLRHHGSRAAVAGDLGIHRNTVRNRVEEIERLLGADLDDPATRFGAWLALEMLDQT